MPPRATAACKGDGWKAGDGKHYGVLLRPPSVLSRQVSNGYFVSLRKPPIKPTGLISPPQTLSAQVRTCLTLHALLRNNRKKGWKSRFF